MDLGRMASLSPAPCGASQPIFRLCPLWPNPARRGVVREARGDGVSFPGRPSDADHSGKSRRIEADQRLVDLEKTLSKNYGTVTGGAVTAPQPQPANTGNGVFWLCLINCVLFLLDHVLHVAWVQSLYLHPRSHRWWQFLTSSFCHADWEHLSSNVFMLYIFGKIVEEEEGPLGVWSIYILCALGSSLVSFFTIPDIVSLGASGAVFGLFIVSVLLKLSWNVKKLLESAILGQFVFTQLKHEIRHHMAGGVMTLSGPINHMAHLMGALVGALVVLLLKQLPEPGKGN